MQQTEVRKDEATNILDNIAQVLHATKVPRFADICNSIRATLVSDAKRIVETSSEMETLEAQYNRYLALRRERDTHEKSAKALVALLGPDEYREALKADASDILGEELNYLQRSRELRGSAALWEHIVQYLRFVPEAQVNDILEFLIGVGVTTSRQAIESAVRTHSDVFAVKKRGRKEKFITLK